MKRGTRITVVMPNGAETTWEPVSDTDTSHVIDIIAMFETAGDEVGGEQ
ncbi:hypothetical protein [Microbacterium excoecariae]|nr:hypothetical protein [Microbacterium excoecariae]NHI16847.1 hypothetical protein [Microbacterium excoecariae]